ncbi:hypothetical protein OIO90_000284 [Microbotryomycetes sp. JL221]|nr:hypothetical protein OIO90_000284 [Microbotryomycetes sp. JL221]
MFKAAIAAASALVVTFVVLAPAPAVAWFPGEHRRFVEEKLIDTGSLGLPNDGLVAAFGDFNGDQLMDVFYLSSDQRTLTVYTWDRSSYSYKVHPQAQVRTKSDFFIVNVVPGDFDYDGRLDVLLMGSKNPGGWWGSDETLDMQVLLQLDNGTLSHQHELPSTNLAQPMVFDADGDMRTDMLAMSPNKEPRPILLKNMWFESKGDYLFNATVPPFDASSFDCEFPDPHFNAFVDLDGDCLADLFLTCRDGKNEDHLSYQIWLNNKSGDYKLARKGKLPDGTKSISFADMDRDGTIDMVMTSCTRIGRCSLSIAYNQQMPLCTSATGDNEKCRDPEALCIADSDFAFDFSTDESNSAFTTIPISQLLPGSSLATETTAFRGHFPTPPSIGDYNIDGYPDLLLVTSSNTRREAQLLQSRPCDTASCTQAEIYARRRAFRVVKDGAEALFKLQDVESAHWVDVDDDGSLDILVQRSGNTGAARKAVFIKNNYFHDAFFLKALVLNGACQGWCEREDGARYQPYGVSYSGASFKFTVLDPAGARRSTQYGQLPQSTYLTLGTPYSYFGLGRTNNYVENLFVGSTRHQPEHFVNVEGLIPNSQVVIVPWQPEDRSDPGTWRKELYLHPGDWIPWVTLALGAAIALLGAVVLFLHINEKRADEMERRARLLSLNVRAMG